MEGNETVEETALRELKEETEGGVRPAILQFIATVHHDGGVQRVNDPLAGDY